MKVHIGRYPKKEGLERKVSVKIDPFDTWNMDYTLALIIHPMLIQLKENAHGAPRVDDEDVPDELKSTASTEPKKHEWEPDSTWHSRWDWVLDEMIWAFETHLDDESQFKVELFGRKRNGFCLFGKYYQALWD